MLTNDIREGIVNSVIIGLKDVGKKIQEEIRDNLYIALNKYELQERCTTLSRILYVYIS